MTADPTESTSQRPRLTLAGRLALSATCLAMAGCLGVPQALLLVQPLTGDAAGKGLEAFMKLALVSTAVPFQLGLAGLALGTIPPTRERWPGLSTRLATAACWLVPAAALTSVELWARQLGRYSRAGVGTRPARGARIVRPSRAAARSRGGAREARQQEGRAVGFDLLGGRVEVVRGAVERTFRQRQLGLRDLMARVFGIEALRCSRGLLMEVHAVLMGPPATLRAPVCAGQVELGHPRATDSRAGVTELLIRHR